MNWSCHQPSQENIVIIKPVNAHYLQVLDPCLQYILKCYCTIQCAQYGPRRGASTHQFYLSTHVVTRSSTRLLQLMQIHLMFLASKFVLVTWSDGLKAVLKTVSSIQIDCIIINLQNRSDERKKSVLF